MDRLRCLTLGLLLASCSPAIAVPPADPWFEQLRVADGLPSGTVYAIKQAPDGFIWIGTSDGLARYDGVEFRTWRHDPKDPSSLASNDVAAVLIDRDGQIWCGGESSGLNQMLPDGSIRRYRHSDDVNSLGSDEVFSIAQDSTGSIWVGTYLGGLNRLREDGSFERIQHDPDIPSSLRANTVIALHADDQGRLWIGTDKGLDVRQTDGSIVHIEIPPLMQSGAPLRVGGFLPEADGSMLVGTLRGVARIADDLSFVGLLHPDVDDGLVTGMSRTEDGGLWIATTNGLVHVEGNEVHRYGLSEPLVGDAPSRRAMDVLRDREGGLWFAFYDGGIARLSAHSRSFSSWRYRPGREDSLQHSLVNAVSVDEEGNVWVVSANDGIDRIDGQTGVIQRFGPRLLTTKRNLRTSQKVGDQLWVGHTFGIRRYALSTSNVVELPVEQGSPTQLPSGFPLRIVRSGGRALWAALGGGGVAHIDVDSMNIRSYTPQAGTLGSDDLLGLKLDSSGQPWVNGTSGIERFDVSLDKFVRVSGAASGSIHALAFAQDGSVWLHWLGALERYSIEADELRLIESIGAADGWPTLQMIDLHVARDQSVWASSHRGLWRWDPATRAVRRFSERDGLPSTEFTGRFDSDDAGVVYAPTRGGVIAFDPTSIKLNAPPSPVHVTRLTVRRGHETVTLDPNLPTHLQHDDRDLTFEVRALSFLDSSGNRYQFQLTGFDTSWIDADTHGARVYAQLPAGHYDFRARVANADGIWSELATPVSVTVSPAPWATPLAYLLYAITIALLSLLWLRAWRWRVEQRHAFEFAEAQRRNAEKLAAAKSRFLATMSHEIRTPMTGVLGMAELLRETSLTERQRGYAEAISRSGEMMLRLVNDSLDLARIEAGKLELEQRPFNPSALLREIIELETPMAQRKGLALNCVIADDVPSRVSGDALRIKQVLLNLVNNALKFTEQGEIAVAMRTAGAGKVEFTIEDTGPGMSADMRGRLFGRFEQSDGVLHRFGGSGLGLSICQEMVQLMRGTIEVQSELGVGTRFIVTVPLADCTGPQGQRPEPLDYAPVAIHIVAGETNPSAHVLVVEDDATIAAVIVGMLESLGHRATHVANGLSALSELTEATIGLALIDLDLPGIDGFQLARMLRDREAKMGLKRMPLIAISARSNGDEEELVRAAGMDAFLRKPLSAARLRAALAPWLGHEEGREDAST